MATCSYIASMRTVGVRELKNRLSEYLRHVRAGERVLVTDRGEVIAELAPPGHTAVASIPPGLVALAKRGLATLPSSPNDASVYHLRPLRRRGRRVSAAQLLDEERGDR